jgi:hypothetical protein
MSKQKSGVLLIPPHRGARAVCWSELSAPPAPQLKLFVRTLAAEVAPSGIRVLDLRSLSSVDRPGRAMSDAISKLPPRRWTLSSSKPSSAKATMLRRLTTLPVR